MLLYVCIGELCMMKSFVLQQRVVHDTNGSNGVVCVEYQVTGDCSE